MFRLLIAFLLLLQFATPAVADRILNLYIGPSGGTYQYFGTGIARLMKNSGMYVLTRASGGSVHNIRLVQSGKADVALANYSDIQLALSGQLESDALKYRNVSVLARLYYAPMQLVVRKNTKILTPKDLKGKRLGVGNEGSGTAALARRLLNTLGIDKDVQKVNVGFRDAAKQLLEKKIDAFFVLSGYPTAAILELSEKIEIDLVNLHELAVQTGLYRAFPSLTPVIIPEGMYNGQTEPVKTFQDSVLLVAGRSLEAKHVTKILNSIFSDEGLLVMRTIHDSAVHMKPDDATAGLELPMHPAAVAYWKERGIMK